MVVQAGEAGPERRAGDIVLDEPVDVDDGRGPAQLDARDEHEGERHHRVDGFHDDQAVGTLAGLHVRQGS